MTNVTFKVEEPVIRKARLLARMENKSLNDVFTDWLSAYVGRGNQKDYYATKRKFAHIRSGKKFSRDELNER